LPTFEKIELITVRTVCAASSLILSLMGSFFLAWGLNDSGMTKASRLGFIWLLGAIPMSALPTYLLRAKLGKYALTVYWAIVGATILFCATANPYFFTISSGPHNVGFWLRALRGTFESPFGIGLILAISANFEYSLKKRQTLSFST
jgi:hypothetical protein